MSNASIELLKKHYADLFKLKKMLDNKTNEKALCKRQLNKKGEEGYVRMLQAQQNENRMRELASGARVKMDAMEREANEAEKRREEVRRKNGSMEKQKAKAFSQKQEVIVKSNEIVFELALKFQSINKFFDQGSNRKEIIKLEEGKEQILEEYENLLIVVQKMKSENQKLSRRLLDIKAKLGAVPKTSVKKLLLREAREERRSLVHKVVQERAKLSQIKMTNDMFKNNLMPESQDTVC